MFYPVRLQSLVLYEKNGFFLFLVLNARLDFKLFSSISEFVAVTFDFVFKVFFTKRNVSVQEFKERFIDLHISSIPAMIFPPGT